MRLFAQLDLARVERVAVGRHQCTYYRMLGLMRLQIADAATLLPPGTADDLMQKLKRALGRARVTVCQAEIGVDHADQIELGEMVALGHKLRADDDVEASLGDVVELLAQPLDRFDEIA